MDKDNRQLVRNHYNSHAISNPSLDRAIATRQQGKAAALKDFHNQIKRLMIKRFAQDAPMLLDLCCGRGGDIIKWFNSDVKFAKGVDISEGEVAEARQRFAETKAKHSYSRKPLDAQFEVGGQLGECEWTDGNTYDVITCMFAMHYFFYTEHTLKMFLHNVALSLKPGGIFMGTIPCGRRVMKLLDGKTSFDSQMLKLEKQWQGKGDEERPFGQAYTFAISDTVTEGRGDSVGSLEYLTFMKPVEGILASHGIFPVKRYNDRALDECLDPADREQTLKHFLPRFPKDAQSLESASALFGAFVFRKSRDAPPPVRLIRPLSGTKRDSGAVADDGGSSKRVRQGGEGGADGERDSGAVADDGRSSKRMRQGGEGGADGERDSGAVADDGRSSKRTRQDGEGEADEACNPATKRAKVAGGADADEADNSPAEYGDEADEEGPAAAKRAKRQ